jgi:hypothetical protein
MFHDAVEAFLPMAAERLGAAPTYEFEKYWTALSPATSSRRRKCAAAGCRGVSSRGRGPH